MQKRLEILPTKKRLEILPKRKFEINHIVQTYSDSALLSQVKPIEEGMLHSQDAEHLETLVEYPLLDTCKTFLDKGITTYASSANQKDVNGDAYIILLYNLLNDDNKKNAERFNVYEYQKEKFVKIAVPVNEKTTVGEVKKKFKEIVDKFENQNQ